MTQTTSSDTPGIDWERVARRALKVILAFGAVVASFIFLTDLARQNGWPWYAALLLPMCIDALGGVALLEYRAGNTRGAGWVAAGAITASFVGNGLSHLYAANVITPTFVSIALIGGVPALSLGLAVHLNKRKEADAPVESGDSDTGDPADVHGNGSGDVPDRQDRPSARPRPTARRSSGTRRGSPNSPLSVPELAALAEREGITSKRQLKAVAHVGDPKVNAAFDLIAANNGH